LLKAENELVNVLLAKALRDEGDRLDGEIPPAEVVEIYRLGLRIAEQTGDKNEILSALNNTGIALAGQDKNAALEIYQRGVRLSEESGNKDMAARILGNIANLYFDQGDFDKSLEYSQKSLVLAEETGNRRAAAGGLGRIGNIYNIRGDYQKALEYQKKALVIREEINDVSGVSFSLNNIGVVLVAQGDYLQAIEYLKKSIELSGNRGAVQIYNLGNTYKAQGDFAKAMNAYQKALNLCQEFGSDECTAAVSINVGDLYNTQGNYEQAANYLNKALVGFEKSGSKAGKASTLGGIARSYQYQGQYQKAVESRQKALALFEEIGAKSDIVNSLNDLGRLFFALGDSDQALGYYQKSLKLNESLNNNEQMSQTFLSIAEIQLSKGDYENALKNAARAKSYYEKLTGFADNWKLYLTFAQAYHGLGRTTEARQNFEKAVAVIENLRTNLVGNEQEQQRYFADKISAYDFLIDFLVAQNDPVEAFAYAERTKSRALLDVLQNGKIDLMKALNVQEREQEQSLKNHLVSLNAQISKESAQMQPDKNRLADLQNQLEKKRLEFEDFQTRLYAAHPQLRIQRGEMNPISLAEAGSLLPDNKSAVLEYIVAREKAFLFVLTKDAAQRISLKAYPISIRQKDLAERTESFRAKMAKGDLDFGKESHDLYNLFLKPAEAQLKDKSNLIIVPDAELWDLPFQALQTAQNRYLIETSAISYAPSLTALREMAKKNKGKNLTDATLLAFGNPTVGKETSERVKQVFMSERLESLPEAERLVNALRQMYGANRSKVFTGAEAREETAKTESSKFRIVQFAAHGILNDISPMYSHIVLAQKQDKPVEDGLLEAWEMKDLDLNADLVILSACETARGRVSGGEGVIGMSWALFIAGAPTTVASQWKIESSSTTELMLEFHRQLLTGRNISKAEALRRAAVKLMKMPRYQHPSYWAGFVMVGDGF
jgi:CHAT domain-containing protein/Flp pilus assembly protein TadD